MNEPNFFTNPSIKIAGCRWRVMDILSAMTRFTSLLSRVVPLVSVAVQVTVVTPLLKTEPLAGEQMILEGQAEARIQNAASDKRPAWELRGEQLSLRATGLAPETPAAETKKTPAAPTNTTGGRYWKSGRR